MQQKNLDNGNIDLVALAIEIKERIATIRSQPRRRKERRAMSREVNVLIDRYNTKIGSVAIKKL